MNPSPLSKRLYRHVSEFSGLSAAMITLATLLPDRATTAQAAFFLIAGMEDIRGRPTTFTDVVETTGHAIGRSLKTTYRLLIDGATPKLREEGKGLGWLKAEVDPADNRRRFLRLTPEGREVMEAVLVAMRGEDIE